jgi:hypothetical protein
MAFFFFFFRFIFCFQLLYACRPFDLLMKSIAVGRSCSPNLVNYQVLVESMDSQCAHIGLYASRDVSTFLPVFHTMFVHMLKLGKTWANMFSNMVFKMIDCACLMEEAIFCRPLVGSVLTLGLLIGLDALQIRPS